MKKVLIAAAVLGGLMIACCGGCFALVFVSGRDAEKAADAFIAKCVHGKSGESYEMVSTALRAKMDRDGFHRFARTAALDDMASVRWTGRRVMSGSQVNTAGAGQTGVATFEGTVAYKSGAVSPIRLEMVKEAGGWRVNGVQITKLPPPHPDDAARLVIATVRSLGDAVAAGDFKKFHADAAKIWREQATPAQMADAFRDLVEKKIDLKPFRDSAPVVDRAPAVNDQGMLTIAGRIERKEHRLTFEFKYLADELDWKPVAVKVEVKQ